MVLSKHFLLSYLVHCGNSSFCLFSSYKIIFIHQQQQLLWYLISPSFLWLYYLFILWLSFCWLISVSISIYICFLRLIFCCFVFFLIWPHTFSHHFLLISLDLNGEVKLFFFFFCFCFPQVPIRLACLNSGVLMRTPVRNMEWFAVLSVKRCMMVYVMLLVLWGCHGSMTRWRFLGLVDQVSALYTFRFSNSNIIIELNKSHWAE